jgi:hypothetical protein
MPVAVRSARSLAAAAVLPLAAMVRVAKAVACVAVPWQPATIPASAVAERFGFTQFRELKRL